MRQLVAFTYVAIFSLPLEASVGNASNLKLWVGDQPLGEAGALYLNVVPQSFEDHEGSKIVYIDLYDDDERQTLTIPHAIGQNKDRVSEIWQVNPGIYRLVRIRFGERTWSRWKNSKLVLVRQGELSNLGKWFLKPDSEDSLAITLQRTRSNYRFEKELSDASPFHAVIDGFAGKTQLVKRGKHAGKLARTGPGGTYVASFSYYQHLSFTYDLKVNRGQHAKPLMSRIDSERSLFQQCYTDQVSGHRSGRVQIQFDLDPLTQRLINLKILRSDLAHNALENCLSNQLRAIQYQGVNDLKGTITFNFNVGQQTL